jgi:hypothetical protein
VLFLYLTVFHEEELPFDTILKIMKDNFRHVPQMNFFENDGGNFRALKNPNTLERKKLDDL